MFYKQRVLANFWGRKDSAICASRKRSGACYWAVFYKQRVLANFWGRKDSAICASRKRSGAYEMGDKQFVFADHAVFSTSKVC